MSAPLLSSSRIYKNTLFQRSAFGKKWPILKLRRGGENGKKGRGRQLCRINHRSLGTHTFKSRTTGRIAFSYPLNNNLQFKSTLQAKFEFRSNRCRHCIRWQKSNIPELMKGGERAAACIRGFCRCKVQIPSKTKKIIKGTKMKHLFFISRLSERTTVLFSPFSKIILVT